MIWLRYFSEQEHGQIIDIQSLLEQRPVAQQLAGEVEWQLHDLPTVAEIEHGIRRRLDMIPGEALQACPSQCALALHALYLKAAVGLQQPLQWRGGVLYECWKQKGSWAEVKNHRSLYISSVVGKLYHRIYRDKTQPQLQEVLHGLHLGSKRRTPLTFAAIYLLGHFRRCRRLKRPVGALFLDTESAYYSIIREVAMGEVCFDTTVAKLFQRFSLCPEDMQALYDLIKNGGVMQATGMTSGARAVIRDIHHRAWFTTRHSTGAKVATSMAGSRPGESFADAVFAYIYSRILKKVADAAEQEGLFTYYAYDEDMGIFGRGEEGTETVAQDATWRMTPPTQSMQTPLVS